MFTLKVEQRDTKTKVRKLRAEKKIPAVFYGRKEKSTPISVNCDDFLKAWRGAGESSILTLETPGKNVTVLIHDVALDPVKNNPIHVDFYAVEADREVEVSVPLVFIGIAPAEKELSGILVKVMHELPVKGLPQNLPHEIEVDLSVLTALDSQIAAKDLKLPPGVSLDIDGEEVVAAMSVAKEEEEIPATFDASAIEVEKKGKKEEEGGESEAAE